MSINTGFSHASDPLQKSGEPDEMTVLMQRLRTLQLRLNSVDPVIKLGTAERVLSWRAVAGETKARENRQTRVRGYVTGSVRETTNDFRKRFEAGFLPRLSESFRTLLPAITGRGETLSTERAAELEDEFGARLSALERRSAEAAAQIADLRATCADTYKRFSEAHGRLDEIWADDNCEGLGGWRVIINKVSAEKQANEKSPMEVFREESLGEENNMDGTSAIGIRCPSCSEPQGYRRSHRGVMDDLLRLAGFAPFHCRRCLTSFHRFRPAKRARRAQH
jgi:hypothetical protein